MRYLAVIAAWVVGVSAAFAAADNAVRINLKEVLRPNNQYTDAAVGMSVKLPAGWTVREASRWGEGYREATVALKPAGAAGGASSMYYKFYTADEVEALRNGGGRALLREQAQLKEHSRQEFSPDYRNEPASMQYFEVGGRPAMAYIAAFTLRDKAMAEHFIRVLGQRGYVMFFTRGSFDEVQALIPQLMQAAATVQAP